jgi:iron complex outermembrane recepter protein
LPGGTAKLAIGSNYREERFRTGTIDYFFSPEPNHSDPAHYSRRIWAGFAELDLPLFGPDNARPGLESLNFTAAVRAEHYDDFGSTTNPKLALRWVPVEGLALRGTWGTSFRAPNLRELGAPGAVNPAILRNLAGNSVVVLQRSGGNPGLAPEKATSWTVGLDVKPRSLAGLTASLTAFRTIFNRRIDLPALRRFSRALIDPTLVPFVRFVNPGANAEDRAFVDALIAESGGTIGYPADTIAAVVDTRYVNTGRIDVTGGDLDIGYAFDAGENHFNLGLSATYLAHWRERLTPTAPTVDQRNVAGRPVDLRGRLTLGWARGPWDALVALNHVDPYRDEAGGRIAAWNTIDLRIAYAPASGAFSGLSIALTAQNLFDKAPPFYDSAAGAGYDGANADATGRFVALEISKRW